LLLNIYTSYCRYYVFKRRHGREEALGNEREIIDGNW